jgi:uncharacterized DUF497 family protein
VVLDETMRLHPPAWATSRNASKVFIVANRHTLGYLAEVKRFSWDGAKNDKLQSGRGISFEEIVHHIGRGDLLDVLEHPNQARYAGQRVFVVKVGRYAYLVPFVETGDEVFLKTIIPSRKATRDYLDAKESNDG